MNRKFLTFAIVFLIFTFVFVERADAKLLPRFSKVGNSTSKISNSVNITARLRSDRKALEVYFSNLSKAKNVTYTLIYSTNGVDQGVSGSLDLSAGNSTSRELLFGTCSSGICTYHSNITNMKLDITSELNSGKTVIKHFRVRV